jgi:toxin ParE1/3/4
MGQVITSPEARADLLEIWLYIATENTDAADRVLSTLNDKTQTLLANPEMGRMREELAHSLRSIPSGSYLIFYRVRGSNIEIIRVLHSARDIQSIWRQ